MRPGLVFGRALLLQIATFTLGFARIANGSAVVNQLMGEADPTVLRQDAHQFLFNFLRRVSLGEREAARNAEDMRIDHNPFGLLEADTENDIGSFARRSGDGDQFGESLRNLTAEIRYNFERCALQGFGFVVEEACGADEVFQLGQGRFGHGLRSREATEQLRRHQIDSNVGALRGEDGRDQQFPWGFVDQSALDFGVGFIKTTEYGRDAFGGERAAESPNSFFGGAFAVWLDCGHGIDLRWGADYSPLNCDSNLALAASTFSLYPGWNGSSSSLSSDS